MPAGRKLAAVLGSAVLVAGALASPALASASQAPASTSCASFLSARETVMVDTPARRATSAMVGAGRPE